MAVKVELASPPDVSYIHHVCTLVCIFVQYILKIYYCYDTLCISVIILVKFFVGNTSMRLCSVCVAVLKHRFSLLLLLYQNTVLTVFC